MHQEFDKGPSSFNDETAHLPSRDDLEALSDQQLQELCEHFGSSLEQLENLAQQLFDARTSLNAESLDLDLPQFKDGIQDEHISPIQTADQKNFWRCITAVGAAGMVMLLNAKVPNKPPFDTSNVYPAGENIEQPIGQGASSQPASPTAPPKFSDINLAKIAHDTGVHSLSIREVSSGRQLSYRGDYEPVSPSSTIQLVIASLVLQELAKPAPRFTLDTVLPPVTSDIAADGVPVGTAYSVRDALTLMLRDGSNTASNLLVRSLGGPDVFNTRAVSLGFQSTRFFNYLSVPNDKRTMPVRAYNSSNLVDLSAAMATIFSNETEAGQIAQGALKNASFGLKYPNSVAHRAGYHPSSLGEVGVVEVRGRLYVVGAFVQTSEIKGVKSQKLVLEDVMKSVVTALERA